MEKRNRNIRLCLMSALAIAAFTSTATAEVSSRECPYSCKTENIPKAQCKDWREGSLCFIDDLRKGSGGAGRLGQDYDPSNASREITTIERVIRSGEEKKVELHDRPIVRIDVVARRVGGGTETKLGLEFEKGTPIGSLQQVDRNDNHVLRFDAGGQNPKGRELLVKASGGDVHVESVHIFYERK